MSRSKRVAILLAVAALLASACGSAIGSTAASVAGVDYSESDLRADLADLEVDGTVDAAATTDWLNGWIFFTAIGLELESRGVVPTDRQIEVAAAELLARDETFVRGAPGTDVRIEQWALRVAAVDWVGELYPDAAPVELDAANPPRMLCSRHILLGTEEEALDVLVRLEDGEDFPELAMELSLDTGSGAAGGELGCVPEGAFVPEFENAAYGADDGEVVGPAQSSFGFHVIEVLSAGPATVEEHPDADPAAIDSARESARTALQNEAQGEVQSRRDQELTELQTFAIVNYADRVTVASEYGSWDSEAFTLVGPGQPIDGG